MIRLTKISLEKLCTTRTKGNKVNNDWGGWKWNAIKMFAKKDNSYFLVLINCKLRLGTFLKEATW